MFANLVGVKFNKFFMFLILHTIPRVWLKKQIKVCGDSTIPLEMPMYQFIALTARLCYLLGTD